MVLYCLLLFFFGVRVSVTFHLMFIHNYFSSVWIAEWLPRKQLPTRLVVCSHCILSICHFIISRLGLKGGVGFLIVPVSVHCLLVFFESQSII